MPIPHDPLKDDFQSIHIHQKINNVRKKLFRQPQIHPNTGRKKSNFEGQHKMYYALDIVNSCGVVWESGACRFFSVIPKRIPTDMNGWDIIFMK